MENKESNNKVENNNSNTTKEPSLPQEDIQSEVKPKLEINNDQIKENNTDTKKEPSLPQEDIQSEVKPKLEINNDEKKLMSIEQKINNKNNLSSIKNKQEKPKKEIPIEKKPFQEFINLHLIPTLKEEFNKKGFQIEGINLNNTVRPIAGDKCWVIYCEIKGICNFWLSFEKDDISSSKSISLSKPNQKPSIIESFLIDEKKITLKLIISRIFQRLNGQKLIGVN